MSTSSPSPQPLSDDEFLLLCRSYADQAARNVSPSPRVDVFFVDPYPDIPASVVEIRLEFDPAEPAAQSASRSASNHLQALIQADPTIAYDRTHFSRGTHVTSIFNLPRAEFESLTSPPPPPPEEAELAPQLDMPTGPLTLKLPNLPPCLPHLPTTALTLGLNLEPKGWSATPYFTRQFPDLERATYWSQKHERQHKDHGYRASTTVLFQSPIPTESLISQVLTALNSPA